jgi:hypothetical protein
MKQLLCCNANVAICMDCAENTIPLLLFTGRCLVTVGCCDYDSCAMLICHIMFLSIYGSTALWILAVFFSVS